jgi:hypothetical protein
MTAFVQNMLQIDIIYKNYFLLASDGMDFIVAKIDRNNPIIGKENKEKNALP